MITSYDLSFARQVTVPALRARLADQRGATMVEYGLVLALVAVVAMVGFTFIGNSTKENVLCTGTALSDSPVIVDAVDGDFYDVGEDGGAFDPDEDVRVASCN